MSAEGKLGYVARDAAFYDVPTERFIEVVRDAFRDLSPAAREEAALRLVLRSERELHGLEKLLPDDGRTASPPPLVERFQEMLDYYADRAEQSPGKGKDRGIER